MLNNNKNFEESIDFLEKKSINYSLLRPTKTALEKSIIDRRIDLMIEEGIKFITSTEVGKDIDIEELYAKNDVVLLCCGATIKRGLPIPGADSKGIIQAMDFLKNQNQII